MTTTRTADMGTYYDSDDCPYDSIADITHFLSDQLTLSEWIDEQNAKLDRDIKLASNRLLRRLRHGRLNYPNKGAMKVS
jgi:hypothetical protein